MSLGFAHTAQMTTPSSPVAHSRIHHPSRSTTTHSGKYKPFFSTAPARACTSFSSAGRATAPRTTHGNPRTACASTPRKLWTPTSLPKVGAFAKVRRAADGHFPDDYSSFRGGACRTDRLVPSLLDSSSRPVVDTTKKGSGVVPLSFLVLRLSSSWLSASTRRLSLVAGLLAELGGTTRPGTVFPRGLGFYQTGDSATHSLSRLYLDLLFFR